MKKTKISTILQYGIVILIFVFGIFSAVLYSIDNPRYDLILENQNLLINAFVGTISISLITLVGSLIFGFVMFVMMRSKVVIIKAIADIFNEIIMGTPLLVMIFLMVYVFGVIVKFDDKLLLGTIALIFYNAPYVANAYETTAAVVDADQYTVMDLYKFKWYQRYIYIIIPQMIKPFIPSLINNLSSVIKSSSLLNILSVTEITYIVTIVSSRTFAFIEGYYVMWLMYLIVTIPLSLAAKLIAKKITKS